MSAIKPCKRCKNPTVFADRFCAECKQYGYDKESRKKVAAVRKFRSAVAEEAKSKVNDSYYAPDLDRIERRQCNYLLRLLLGHKPTKKEINQALHLEDMD